MKLSDLEEKKSYKRFSGYKKLVGNGNHDDGMTESLADEKNYIKDFIRFCFKELNLKKKPRIRLTNYAETTALGYFDPETNTISVVVKGRHPMDVIRTIAHELVHLKQSEKGNLDGATGSEDENEANAIAGILMRIWGKLRPEGYSQRVQNEI